MSSPSPRHLAGVALVSATILMTELALTRIFSVVMYYHFAFLAISIALFGLSASGVFAYVARRRLGRYSTDALLATESLIKAIESRLAKSPQLGHQALTEGFILTPFFAENLPSTD